MDSDRHASYLDVTKEGDSLVRRGDFRRAIDNFERAVVLAKDLDDQSLLVKALCNLSSARLAAGDIREAEQGLREILMRTRDAGTIFAASSTLASALRRQGRLDRALLYAKKALRACEGLDNVAWLASCHNLIANLHLSKSCLDEAVAEYRYALTLYEKEGLGTEHPVEVIKENLGYCLLLKKRYRQGIAIILEALQISLSNGNTRCLAECHQDLSFAYMQLKEYERAREHGEKAYELAVAQEYTDLHKNCCYLLGEIHLMLEDEERSDYYFDRLQAFFPNVPVLKEFLRTFDVSSIINFKTPV